MKKSAYTLAEIMIVVVILSVLTMLTTTTLFNSPKTRYRKVAAYSSTFYSHASSAYTEILTREARNYTIENLEDASGDGKVDSSDLTLYFAKYIGGQVLESVALEESGDENKDDSNPDASKDEDKDNNPDVEKTNCNNLMIDSKSDILSYKNDAVCADFNNVIAGFVYDKNCSLTIKAKEFLSKDEVDAVASSDDYEPSERSVSNLCGYIVYSVKDSKGIFKKDLFTIPLGKRSVK